MNRCALTFVLLTSPAVAQAVAAKPFDSFPTDLQVQLRKLAADALSLERDLPNFTCTETAASQNIRKGKIKTNVQFEGNIRSQRDEAHHQVERVEYTSLNGRPYTGPAPRMPIFLDGGFTGVLMYFLPLTQHCFTFSLDGNRLNFAAVPGSMEDRTCASIGAPDGYALLAASGDIVYVERHVTDPVALNNRIVPYAAQDFVMTDLGGKRYPLVARTVGDIEYPKETHHFEATYTACHLFHADIRIVPIADPETTSSPHP